MLAFRGRLVVTSLSVLWTIITLWHEYLQFRFNSTHCKWPDHHFKTHSDNSNLRPQHILVVADPQILDHRSYPERGAFLTWLSRIIVDLNLRKNWWVARSTKPDAVVFLGDMMDGGRFDMPEEEYSQYYARFKDIFRLDNSIPQFYVPGNHDTGLGTSQSFSPYSHIRYTTHFGELNYVIQMSNHTLAFIDAPGLVDEEYKRVGLGRSYEHWKPLPGGTLEFAKRFHKAKYNDPIILFTHVPLYRPDGHGCGPHRERGSIRPGVGPGYQNTLAKETSIKVLELLQPSLILSGDDHDYCEHTHALPTGLNYDHTVQTVREVTVKSLSMAMGIRRPGFQLLSLAPNELRIPVDQTLAPNVRSHADALCLLPDQLGTYLSVYIPFLIISLLIVIISNFITIRRPSHSSRFSGRITPSISGDNMSQPKFRLTPSRSGLRPRRDEGSSEERRAWSGDEGADEKMHLPAPVSSGLVSGMFSTRTRGRRRSSKLSACLYDVRDIAVYPISIFIFISLWFTYF